MLVTTTNLIEGRPRAYLEFPATSVTRTARIYLTATGGIDEVLIIGNINGHEAQVTWNNASGSRYFDFQYRTVAGQNLSVLVLATDASETTSVGLPASTLR